MVVSFVGSIVDSGVIMLWEEWPWGRDDMGIRNLKMFLCSIPNFF